MRVLLITQYFPPEIGAAASRWGDYTNLMVKQGHQVTVLCEMPNYPKGNYFPGYNRSWVKKEIVSPNLTIIRSASGANDRKSPIKKITHYFVFMISGLFNVRKIKNHDLVIISSPPLFVGLIGVYLKKCKSVDFWLDIRDIWPESAFVLGQIKKNFFYIFGKKLESIIYDSAKGFILTVPGFREYFNKKYFLLTRKPTLNLLNGISEDFLLRSEKLKIKPDKRFTVLYSGNLGLAQGLETIIEAAKLLEKYPIDFRLIGNGVSKNKLEELVRIKKQKNVFFHDSMSRFELIKWIKKSSVCLVPLTNNPLFQTALPSKMFEYMACERPVIVGIKGEVQEIINVSKSGVLVEPENPILLSQAILNYFENTDICKSHGMNGMTYITKKLRKEDLISALMNEINFIENN